jgi:LacI family transcriptional regulator
MNYTPNAAGKALAGKRSNIILLNFSDFDRLFYVEMFKGIHDYTEEAGYDLIVSTTRSSAKFMHNRLTDGAIILDVRMQNEVIAREAGERYPVIVLDRPSCGPYVKAMLPNNYEAMTVLVQGLLDAGYRSFAFVAGLDTNDTRERFRGFSDVLARGGIPFSRSSLFTGDFTEESGRRAANLLTLAKELPEVIVCANDNMAIGVIKSLREHGIRVPEDVAVTGFDNIDQAAWEGITTVAVPNYELGYLSARALVENIGGKHDYETRYLNAKVIWRKTTENRG